ncbi:hypothetical protein DRO38_06855, partial [Candidatus Bathyarchaeota archaeon]
MYYKRESLEELRQLADPKEVLIHVGGVSAASIKDNGYEIRCPCPLHGGDNDSGFSWKSHEGMWTCFTKECGKGSGRDIYAFVMLKNGIQFNEAAELVAKMFGYSLEKGNSEGYSAYMTAAEARKDFQAMQRTKPTKLEVLRSLPGYYESGSDHVSQYLKFRGYEDQNLVWKFKFYPCIDSHGILRMGIPAYNELGELVGVNARRMDGVLEYPSTVVNSLGKEKKIAKYDMIANFKKGAVLFNLHRAKDNLVNDGLILVEGELSAVRMDSYGYHNTIASRGSSLSNQQANLIYRSCFNLTFLVEADEAAEKGAISSMARLSGMKILVAKLEQGDPDDNSAEDVAQCLQKAVQYTEKDIQWCI